MSDSEPAAPDEVIAPLLVLVACNKCRRRRGAQLHQTGRADPGGTCPHGKTLRTIWAPGHGPGSPPKVDPSTPEERRWGAV
ncbi:hypothetical protein [Frankia sp. AiPs1]